MSNNFEFNKQNIEFIVFTESGFADQQKTDETYEFLMKKYKTDKVWLDNMFFDKYFEKLFSLNEQELLDYIENVRKIIQNYFEKKNEYLESFFRFLRDLMVPLYCDSFKQDFLYWTKFKEKIQSYYREIILEQPKLKDTVEPHIKFLNNIESKK